MLFYVCLNFGCVVLVVIFIFIFSLPGSASMMGWPRVGPRGPHMLPPKGHGPGKAR